VGPAFLERALAYSERHAKEQGKRHKKITEWVWQMLLLVRRWHPEREIVAVADRSYASLKLLDRCRNLREPITFVTRLRLDAALYDPAPPRKPGQRGRPRLKGERLPNLSVVAEDPSTAWKLMEVANWYGKGERTIEVASATAVWYSTGLFVVPLCWVLIRDPRETFATQALLCTDLASDPQTIVSWFIMRWQLQATFQEVLVGILVSRRNDSAQSRRSSGPRRRCCWLVLAGHAVCPSPDDEEGGSRSALGLVRQDVPDLRRCVGVGRSGVVSSLRFLRVVSEGRHGKSPTGVFGTVDRCSLLRCLTAKVELRNCLVNS
jgi:DDE superfamily endonuclease